MIRITSFFIYREELYIINWITMTRKSSKYCAWHMEPLEGCFDLISSHQQCIPWSLWLEIEPATTECIAKTLLLSYLSILYTSDCWWDLIRLKKLSSSFLFCAQCLPDFLVMIIQFIKDNFIKNLNFILKKFKHFFSKSKPTS